MKIIQTLEDRVLVKPNEAIKETTGGIIIPKNIQEEPKAGVVLMAGNGIPGKPTTVQAGDIVLYGKYAGTVVESEGEKLLMLRESDIICILAPDLAPDTDPPALIRDSSIIKGFSDSGLPRLAPDNPID